MSKVKSTSQESMELAALLESKPQIDQKIKYYINILKSSEELYMAIQERMDVGYTIKKSLILGVIPINTKVVLDDLDMARLNMELQDIEDTVFNQKQYYENWLNRVKEYENKVDEITRDCNQNFDLVINEAKTITNNIRLIQTIIDYKNVGNDQNIKNEFFLYLKQEINNNQVYNSKRR